VVLPNLARHHSTNSQEAYSAVLDWALRLTILIGLPAAVALLVLGGPILTTLIHYGAFGVHDVQMTQRSLWAFAVGLPSFMLIKILASAYYSRQNIRTPVKIAVYAVIVNLVFNLILIHPLAHAGLALSTTIASWFNALCLLVLLLRKKIFIPHSGWWFLLLRIVVANVLMAAMALWLAGPLQRWFAWSAAQRVYHLGEIMVVGVVIYFAALFLMGLRFKHFMVPKVAAE
jgi:putative peptidoglycan lipid II flippase